MHKQHSWCNQCNFGCLSQNLIGEGLNTCISLYFVIHYIFGSLLDKDCSRLLQDVSHCSSSYCILIADGEYFSHPVALVASASACFGPSCIPTPALSGEVDSQPLLLEQACSTAPYFSKSFLLACDYACKRCLFGSSTAVEFCL